MSPEKRPYSPAPEAQDPTVLESLLRRRGINPKTYEFITVCISQGVHQNLTAIQRNLIGVYHGTSSSLDDLRQMAETGNKQTVKNRIMSGMTKMWQSLPPEDQTRFPKEETLLLKNPHSEETRKKMSEAQRANWQDPEYRTRQSDAIGAIWQNPQYRARMSNHLETLHQGNKGKTPSEETRRRMSEARRELWQDPDYRARMSEAQRARQVREKAARNKLT